MTKVRGRNFARCKVLVRISLLVAQMWDGTCLEVGHRFLMPETTLRSRVREHLRVGTATPILGIEQLRLREMARVVSLCTAEMADG